MHSKSPFIQSIFSVSDLPKGTAFFLSFLVFFFSSVSFSYSAQAVDEATVLKGKRVYQRYCYGCHGYTGNGNGPYAKGLNPKPRNFTKGIFKWTSGPSGSVPSDSDLDMTISEGVHGTTMPPWRALRASDRHYVIAYIKTFSSRFTKEAPAREVFNYPSAPANTPAMIENGKKTFAKIGCSACHGTSGRGDGPSAATLTDDWGDPIQPANFTKGVFKTGNKEWKIFRTISNGVGGTPMPSFADQLEPAEIWELVYYVRSLKGE
jgi:cytochrome c oxidase cbb3-type subunit 2